MDTPTQRHRITPPEIKRARELRAQGLALKEIKAQLLTESPTNTAPSLPTLSRYTHGLKPPPAPAPRKRTRTKEQRARESAQQSAQRREERANESPEEGEARRAYNRLTYAAWVEARAQRETPAQRESRLERDRQRRRARTARRQVAQQQEEGANT
jgi:DNA-binding transcriptional MerR regulator